MVGGVVSPLVGGVVAPGGGPAVVEALILATEMLQDFVRKIHAVATQRCVPPAHADLVIARGSSNLLPPGSRAGDKAGAATGYAGRR